MNLLTQVRALFEPALRRSRRTRRRCPTYLGAIKPSSNADHGDYQANCAMALAKALGARSRRTCAQGDRRRPSRRTTSSKPPTVAGPGFINLRLKSEFLAHAVAAYRHRSEARRRARGEAEDVRDRPERPERGEAAARRPPPQHDHRRRARPHPALPRPHGRRRQPPRRLGHAVRHPAVRLQEPPRRRGVRGRPGARTGPPVRPRPQPGEDRGGRGRRRRGGRPVMAACREETAKLHAGDAENVALWKTFMPACLEMLRADLRAARRDDRPRARRELLQPDAAGRGRGHAREGHRRSRARARW